MWAWRWGPDSSSVTPPPEPPPASLLWPLSALSSVLPWPAMPSEELPLEEEGFRLT